MCQRDFRDILSGSLIHTGEEMSLTVEPFTEIIR